MSSSTVSVTPSQGPITRRRAAAERTHLAGTVETGVELTASQNAAVISRDLGSTPASNVARNPGSGPTRKPKKPRWLTVISILTKNLILIAVLFGFVQSMRWMVMYPQRDVEDFSVVSGGFDGKLSEMEKVFKTSVKGIQVQLNALGGKIHDEISSVRKDLNEQIVNKGVEMDLKLKALDARNDAFQKFMDDFKSKNVVLKEDFDKFVEDFKKSSKSEVSWDEIIAYAKDIVNSELEKHSADGLGMVDYALASGGGKVVKHSEPFVQSGGWLLNRNKISPESEKLIKPSFGEPGQCFPFKGASGFVEIRLRTAIVPTGVTLEHVSKSVAYDRSSAPKDCRISGWLGRQDPSELENDTKMFQLTEFTYDLDKSSAQTVKINVPTSNIVDTIRLDIMSNHGSVSHTCIYRLRVHGYEPKFVQASKTQS